MPTISAMELVRKKILEPFYLQRLDGTPKTELYQGDLERIVHGNMHASRTAIWLEVIINLMKDVDPAAKLLTDEDIDALYLVAFFHDAARKGENEDIWEAESAERAQEFLEAIGYTKEKAAYYASIILTKENFTADAKREFMHDIFQSADALDIMRCKEEFQLDKLNILVRFIINKRPDLAINLSSNVLQCLAKQQDLLYDTQILLDNVCIAKHPATCNPKYKEVLGIKKSTKEDTSSWPRIDFHPDIDLKERYEHDPLCYERLRQEIRNNPFFHQYLPKDHPFTNRSYDYQPTEETTKRHQIRESAPKKEIHDAFVIKSFSHGVYYLDFLDGLLPGEKHKPLRRGNKLRYTVTGDGVIDRMTKQPLYTPTEKQGFSKAQACSIGTPAFHTPVFNFSFQSKKVTGAAFFNLKNVLLSNQLSTTDFGSVDRPLDFDDDLSAHLFFTGLKKNRRIYSKKEFDDYKKAIESPEIRNTNRPTEALARLKWKDDGSFYFIINTDTLDSRLLALAQARILKQRLLKKGLCSSDYEIPIIFYDPRKPDTHLKYYCIEEQRLDKKCVDDLLNSSSLRDSKYNSQNFEFLTHLSKEQFNELVLTEQARGIDLKQYLVANDNLHIPDYLRELEITNDCNYQDNIRQLIEQIHLITLSASYRSALQNNKVEDSTILKMFELMGTLKSQLTTVIQRDRADLFGEILHDLTLYPVLKETFATVYGPELIGYSLSQKKNPQYLELLSKHINFNNLKFNLAYNPLHLAVEMGNIDSVKCIMKNAPELANKQNQDGNTPLHLACMKRNHEIVDILLNYPHINYQVKNKDALTALVTAIKHDQPLVLLEFLKHFPELIKRIDDKDQTILHLTFEYKALACMKYFCVDNKMVDINAQDKQGNTILHNLAIFTAKSTPELQKVFADLLGLLLLSGARLYKKNNRGETAFDITYIHQEKDLLKAGYAHTLLLANDYLNTLLNENDDDKSARSILLRKLKNDFRLLNSSVIDKKTIHACNQLMSTIDCLINLDKEVEEIWKNMPVTGDQQKVKKAIDTAYQHIESKGQATIDELTRYIDRLKHPTSWSDYFFHLFKKTATISPQHPNHEPDVTLTKRA